MGGRKRYSTEFKQQALRRADEPGVTDTLICEALGISTRQLRCWRDSASEFPAEKRMVRSMAVQASSRSRAFSGWFA